MCCCAPHAADLDSEVPCADELGQLADPSRNLGGTQGEAGYESGDNPSSVRAELRTASAEEVNSPVLVDLQIEQAFLMTFHGLWVNPGLLR